MSATAAPAASDRSDFRTVTLGGAKLGVATAVAVVAFLAASRLVPVSGGLRVGVEALIVLAAGVAVTFLPAQWTAARSTEGIAGAAAMGLVGTVVFSVIDIVLLRPFKAYPWTWDAIGGGSTWWYLPVWWMLGTFVAWMGGIVIAAGRNHDPTHPRYERAQHPPHGEVPPRASAADRVPRPGICLEGPQQHDIDDAEDHGADEAHGRGARDALGAPRRRPLGGKEGDGHARRQHDQRLDPDPQATADRYEPRRREERDDRYRRRDAEFRAAQRDGAEVRAVRSRGCRSGRHGSSLLIDGVGARRGNLSAGSHRANTSKTTRSVMAHAASARYIPRWWPATASASRRRYQGTSTASQAANGTTSGDHGIRRTAVAQPNSTNASAVHARATPRLARRPRSRARVRSPRRRSSSI